VVRIGEPVGFRSGWVMRSDRNRPLTLGGKQNPLHLLTPGPLLSHLGQNGPCHKLVLKRRV